MTIAVAGDVHFEGVLRDRLDDPATALAPATSDPGRRRRRDRQPGDLGRKRRPTRAGQAVHLPGAAAAFDALAAAGIDVATMANNHALDFGREPLPGTFAAIDARGELDPPLAVVGLGQDADAGVPARAVDVDGTVVATIGATIADTDPTADPTGQWAATEDGAGDRRRHRPGAPARRRRAADRSADVVVVYMHWGVQGEPCPSRLQRSLADRLVDAGADVVVGSHAHRLQGDGRLGEATWPTGSGNYAWYTQPSDATSVTGVLTLTVQPAPSRGRGGRR